MSQIDNALQFDPDVENALSAYAGSRRIHREDAIKQILRDWLLNEGFLHSGEQGIPPEKLNASNDD